jgi:hypothetical protein
VLALLAFGLGNAGNIFRAGFNPMTFWAQTLTVIKRSLAPKLIGDDMIIMRRDNHAQAFFAAALCPFKCSQLYLGGELRARHVSPSHP